jgi:uroporphyrinogen-III synthase
MPQPRLLLTRPQLGAAQFLERLSPALRMGAVISPLVEIAPTAVLVDLTPFAGVIFTSANGVTHAPAGGGMPAYCVGPQTTAAAAKSGWQAQMAGLDAEAMIANLSGRTNIGPLLHLAGRHRRSDIAGILSASGLTTQVVIVYEQNLMPLSPEAQALLEGSTPVIVPLFSPRSAHHFAQQAARTTGVMAVSISSAAAEALEALPLYAHDVAAEPTGEAMAEAVEKLFRRTTLP